LATVFESCRPRDDVLRGAIAEADFAADPANGRVGDGVFAHTPWGEQACALAGKAGYDRVRKSDESLTAPGAETPAELFGGEPSPVLRDELSVYLRKTRQLHGAAAGEQMSAFLTSLFKAVESNPRVALVYTLAIGKEGGATDAYGAENQFIADKMFRALAPMRSRDNRRNVVEGIEAMGKEEAAYWLGMAMHRKSPRRVLTSLRVLLTLPSRPRPGTVPGRARAPA
jgi:hypothetical protein